MKLQTSPAANGMIKHDVMTMDPLDALHSQHSVPVPKISFDDAVTALEQFEKKVKDLPVMEQKRRAGDPSVTEAMFAYLFYRFTPVDLEVARQAGASNAGMEPAGLVLKLSSPQVQRRFFE